MFSWLKKLRKKSVFSLVITLFVLFTLGGSFYLSKISFRRIRQKAATSKSQNIQQENDLLKVDLVTSYPVVINKAIYRLSIDGDISFQSKKGLIRIILTDKNNKEYLVYEVYPLLINKDSFSFADVCDETCVLEGVVPLSLRVEGYKATFNRKNISLVDNPGNLNGLAQKLGLARERERLKREKDIDKIRRLNEGIKQSGMKWIAGETPISKMTYDEKKKLFSLPDRKAIDYLPNLQGFEYYKGGVFEIQSGEKELKRTVISSNLRPSWDWRNVNGENWMTPVKNQGPASTCWAFAAIGSIESLINLYYNQHLDKDLSEQMFIDCANSSELPMSMAFPLYPDCSGDNLCFPGCDLCVASIHGIPDEACDPYAARGINPPHCDLDHVCSDWQDRVWKFNDFHDYKFGSDRDSPRCSKQTMNPTEDEFKKVLIQKGPMNGIYMPWGHAMVLTGYETDPVDNRTIWIFKNSWGVGFGEGGYARIKSGSLLDLGWGSLPKGPVTPPADETYPITCLDNDGDSYCNWGISEEKPDSCISFCQEEKDCDDSNPNLGPFGADFNCIPINATPTPMITPIANECWGTNGRCDLSCNKSFISLHTVYSDCNANLCYCGWRDVNGNKCSYAYYAAYYSEPGCSGTILGYGAGGICSTDGTGTCYNGAGTASGTYQSVWWSDAGFCLNASGSFQGPQTLFPCTWQGDCFSYSVSNPLMKYAGSGTCSSNGSGNCYKLINGETYYTKGGACGAASCSSATYYSDFARCSWIASPALPDLTVTDFHLTATPKVGEPLYASVTYKNIGEAVSPMFTHRFILNNDVVYEYFFVSLKPGEKKTIELDDRLPNRNKWQPKAGGNILITEVDYTQTIVESNEDNNFLPINFTLPTPTPTIIE